MLELRGSEVVHARGGEDTLERVRLLQLGFDRHGEAHVWSVRRGTVAHANEIAGGASGYKE